MGFSCCFLIEAKEFQVSVSDGGLVKVSEWSHKNHISISLGRFGAVWLANMASNLLVVEVECPFVLKFNDAS